MAALEPKPLRKRAEKALQGIDQFRSLWRDAYRYVLPQRDILENPQPGQTKGTFVFDGTGATSANRLVNRIQDLLFPIGQPFVAIEPGPATADNKNESLKKDLQKITNEFHAAIWRSNFPNMIAEFLIELLVGTGTMLMNKGPEWNPFHFHAFPTPLIGLEGGPWGTISLVARKAELPVSVIKLTWPGAKIEQADEDRAKEDPNHKKNIIEITYADDESRAAFGSMEPTRWYYDVLIAEGTEESASSILETSRVYENASPWIIGRWTKASNENYGRGPVINALPAIRTANKVVELILKNASLAISGVWTAVNDGILNPNMIRIVPGAVIPVGRNPGHPQGASLAGLERTGDFDIAQLVLQDERFAIKETLFDAQLPPITGPVHSPTEFIERMRELFVDIGPGGGRILTEVLTPMVLRGITILADMNKIDIPEGIAIDGDHLAIRIVAPIARKQALDELQRVFTAIDLVGSLGQEVLFGTVKVEEIPAYVWQQLQVPLWLLRDEGERVQVAELIAQMTSAALGISPVQNPEQPGLGGEVEGLVS